MVATSKKYRSVKTLRFTCSLDNLSHNESQNRRQYKLIYFVYFGSILQYIMCSKISGDFSLIQHLEIQIP